ncbi:TM2 domain-containing protein [candidate division WOR-3 bacterium]|nr:TM2 domain-containing protein [candidate division WOR-3 bacterium]
MKPQGLLLLLPLVFLVALQPLYAQTETADDEPSLPVRTEPIPALDSLRQAQADSTQNSTQADTLQADTVQVPSVKKKSVGAAMLLSTFIPGGGQFYTGHYIKGLLITWGEITLGYFTWQEHVKLQNALKGADLSDSLVVKEIDSFRTRRNSFAFFTGAVIVYAVADAYVDAHMYGFAEAQRLTVGPSRERLGLEISYKF